MTEKLNQAGEHEKNPVEIARSEFNRELFGKEYTKGVLSTKVVQLQNALLGSTLTPERIYHELMIVAGQGAERAEIFSDEETAATLREMQRGFELTYEVFKPRVQAEKSSEPTTTSNLPPMTSPKGGERVMVFPEAIKDPRRDLGSFFRKKRKEAGLTQAKLEEKTGIRKSKISGFEYGKIPLESDELDQIAGQLNLNEEDKKKLLDLYNSTGKNK